MALCFIFFYLLDVDLHISFCFYILAIVIIVVWREQKCFFKFTAFWNIGDGLVLSSCFFGVSILRFSFR